MFFGTPHAGPTNDLKVKFGRACVAIAQSMPWKVFNDLMKALEKGSLFSDVLYENWRHQLEQYHFVSLYEGLGTARQLSTAKELGSLILPSYLLTLTLILYSLCLRSPPSLVLLEIVRIKSDLMRHTVICVALILR